MGLLSNRGPPDWHPATKEIKDACAKAAVFCNVGFFSGRKCKLLLAYLSWKLKAHFHLLQNNSANFNQTWHKASFRKGDSVCWNKEPRPFPRGYNYEIAKYVHYLTKSKNHLLQSHCPNYNQTWHKALLDGGDSNLLNAGQRSFLRGDNHETVKKTLTKFKNPLLQNHWVNFK